MRSWARGGLEVVLEALLTDYMAGCCVNIFQLISAAPPSPPPLPSTGHSPVSVTGGERERAPASRSGSHRTVSLGRTGGRERRHCQSQLRTEQASHRLPLLLLLLSSQHPLSDEASGECPPQREPRHLVSCLTTSDQSGASHSFFAVVVLVCVDWRL